MEKTDDGSLEFLNIPLNPEHKIFHCDMANIADYVDKTFWVFDYCENAKTKFGDRVVVLVGPDKDCKNSEKKKFVTGSSDILYILGVIKERGAFPRKVTMHRHRNSYYFE